MTHPAKLGGPDGKGRVPFPHPEAPAEPNFFNESSPMTNPPTSETKSVELKPSDIEWLEGLRESGHCGEGSLELRHRAKHNDRIERLLAALASPSPDKDAEIARLRAALGQWTCGSCGGTGVYKNRSRERGSEALSCKICGGSGRHPIARRALGGSHG